MHKIVERKKQQTRLYIILDTKKHLCSVEKKKVYIVQKGVKVNDTPYNKTKRQGLLCDFSISVYIMKRKHTKKKDSVRV